MNTLISLNFDEQPVLTCTRTNKKRSNVCDFHRSLSALPNRFSIAWLIQNDAIMESTVFYNNQLGVPKFTRVLYQQVKMSSSGSISCYTKENTDWDFWMKTLERERQRKPYSIQLMKLLLIGMARLPLDRCWIDFKQPRSKTTQHSNTCFHLYLQSKSR